MDSNRLIDLHMHSVNSDGSETTEQLLEQLFSLGVEIMSFTDHDSVDCYYDLKKLTNTYGRKMTIVKGVEFSFVYQEKLRDMLGYGIDIDKAKDFLNLKYSLDSRIMKQRGILDKFKKICKSKGMIFDDSVDVSTGNKSEAFVVLYYELNKHKDNIDKFPFIIDNTSFYWKYFANMESDYYVSETEGLPTIDEIINVIKSCGGKPFLAHPFAYSRNMEHNNLFIKTAINKGIEGIEVKHSSNQDDDAVVLTKIAKSNNLLISGGSDFHGKSKPKLKLVSGFDNMKVDYSEISNWIDNIDKILF